MPITLNLLPPEHVVTGKLGGILKTVRMLNVILLASFILFTLGIAAFWIFQNIQLQGVNSANNQLISQISAQESAEQRLVLLKDRIDKIELLQRSPSSAGNLKNISPFVNALGANSSLSELDMDSQKIDMSVLFRSNSDLFSFIKTVSSSTTFKSIELSSFGYNPSNGYLASFHIL